MVRLTTPLQLFIYQTLCGLHYLECTRYLHRDVKPENLLVNMDTGMLKIGDFGSAKRYRPGEANSAYQVTRYYRAPELCMKFTRYDSTVDIWAVGCILTELLTNRIMFYGSDNADQLKKILRICGTPDKEQLRACVGGQSTKNDAYTRNRPSTKLLESFFQTIKSIPKCWRPSIRQPTGTACSATTTAR